MKTIKELTDKRMNAIISLGNDFYFLSQRGKHEALCD
jgi:hypothetical protein